jgi:hypothetical protein
LSLASRYIEVFDFFHRLFVQNPGVPVWRLLLSFDVIAGCFLAMLLMRRSGVASKV